MDRPNDASNDTPKNCIFRISILIRLVVGLCRSRGRRWSSVFDLVEFSFEHCQRKEQTGTEESQNHHVDSRDVRDKAHDAQDEQQADDEADERDEHDTTAGCHNILNHGHGCCCRWLGSLVGVCDEDLYETNNGCFDGILNSGKSNLYLQFRLPEFLKFEMNVRACIKTLMVRK